MKKVVLAYISDQRYYVDNNGNWYTTAAFPLDIINAHMPYIKKWIFFGRLYRTNNVSHLYRIPLDKTSFDVSFKGSWEQKRGVSNHLKNMFHNIVLLNEVIAESNIIWLKFSFVASYLTYLFCPLNNKVIVTHLVGDIDCYKGFLHRVIRWIQKKIIYYCNKRADIQVFVSKRLADKYAYNKKPYMIVNENRVSKSMLCTVADIKKRTMREDFKVLFVGRFSWEKGIFDLIKVVGEIRNGIKLTLVGDGILRKDIERHISQHSLEDIVDIYGYVAWGEKLFRLIRQHDILVLPSYSEGLPLVLLEAMSMGVPIVASQVGGIPEIVKDEYNGLLFEPKNTKELKQKILLLMENENLRYYLACNGLETARENVIETQIGRLSEAIIKKSN
ncbi:MAG: glycosyltransferase family 4 protein [Clostridiales bacterium]|nr:glycosyltransferase family 4 protein [Clostridiales bacterium]